MSARRPPTLKPNQQTWAVSPPVGHYGPHPPLPFIITVQPQSWYSFHYPMESGRLSRPRHCIKGVQPVPKAGCRSGCRDKHNCPRWDFNLGSPTPRSAMLPLHHSRGARRAVRAPHQDSWGPYLLFFRSLSKVENLSSRKKLSSSMFTTSKSKPHICISKLCFWGEWHNTPENIAHFRPFWSRCEMFSTISLPPKHIVYL